MAIRVPYNEQKVNISPIRIAQARPDTAGAAAGQALARGIGDIGQVASQAADYQFKLQMKEREDLDRAALDKYEGQVAERAATLQGRMLEYKQDKVQKAKDDLDLPQLMKKQFQEEVAKIDVPDYLKAKASSISSRYETGLTNKATAYYVNELDKWKEEQAQSAIALKARSLAETDINNPADVKNGITALVGDLEGRYSGERLKLEKEKLLQAALYQQAVNTINLDPDNLAKVKESSHIKENLTKEHFQKLDDLARQRNTQMVTKSKDALYQSTLIPAMENKQIIDTAEIAKNPLYQTMVKRDATQAASVASSIATHNENTATNTAMSWIAAQRAGGKQITSWAQLPTDYREHLLEYAPAKANALMNRFDAERDIRRQQADMVRSQKAAEATALAAVTMDPNRLDTGSVIEARNAGRISPKFASDLLKAIDQGTDYIGAVKRNMDQIDMIVDARLPNAKEEDRRKQKEYMMSIIVAAAPGIYKSANDITSKDISDLGRLLDIEILKGAKTFKAPATVGRQMRGMAVRQTMVEDEDRAVAALQLKSLATGNSNPLSHGYARPGQFRRDK